MTPHGSFKLISNEIQFNIQKSNHTGTVWEAVRNSFVSAMMAMMANEQVIKMNRCAVMFKCLEIIAIGVP